jgi:hypothetical protein
VVSFIQIGRRPAKPTLLSEYSRIGLVQSRVVEIGFNTRHPIWSELPIVPSLNSAGEPGITDIEARKLAHGFASGKVHTGRRKRTGVRTCVAPYDTHVSAQIEPGPIVGDRRPTRGGALRSAAFAEPVTAIAAIAIRTNLFTDVSSGWRMDPPPGRADGCENHATLCGRSGAMDESW